MAPKLPVIPKIQKCLLTGIKLSMRKNERPRNDLALEAEWTWETYRQRSRRIRRTTLSEWRIFKYTWAGLVSWFNWRRNSRNILKFIFCRFGIIETLMSYKVSYIARDLLAGLSISFFHLSQGLAYGDLAGLTGANGLYVSMYAPLVYAIFGTSKHISIGTFAALSLLVEQSITNAMEELYPNQSNMTSAEALVIREQISMTLTVLSGIVMVGLALLHVGALVVFLTRALVGGYLCAAAFFVFTSQMSSGFGIKVARSTGFGLFFKRWVSIFKNIKHTNLVTMGITIVCIAFLWLGRKLNQRFIKYIRVSLPLEVMCIAIACTIGSTTNFFPKNNVTLTGHFPSGLQRPQLPNMTYAKYMTNEIFATVFVTMAINFAVILHYAELYKYEVSTHQDLFAYGLVNIFCGFFQCFPPCGSLSRTAVAIANGQQTQLSAVVSSLVLVIILYAITKYLAKLPVAVLSGIVIFNISGSMAHIVQAKRYWSIDFMEGFVWIASFVSVLLFDLDKGLIIAMLISVVLNTILMVKPRFRSIGELPNKMFADILTNPEAKELPGIKIVRMEGPLLSYNARYFKLRLLQELGLAKSHNSPGIAKLINMIMGPEDSKQSPYYYAEPSPSSAMKLLIIDCSSMVRIDSVGIRTLKEIKQLLQCNSGARLRFACVSEEVCASVDAEGSYEELFKGALYHGVEDAVTNTHSSKASHTV